MEKEWDRSKENQGFSKNTTEERESREGRVEGSNMETTTCCSLHKLLESDVYKLKL